MNFKKWVISIQTAGYNGARTVYFSLGLREREEKKKNISHLSVDAALDL